MLDKLPGAPAGVKTALRASQMGERRVLDQLARVERDSIHVCRIMTAYLTLAPG